MEKYPLPVTDSSSYFGKGRLTLLANHDTAAQQLAAIIETGEGGLIVVDGGWTDNTDYVLNQIKAKGGHVQAWLITHPDSDHVVPWQIFFISMQERSPLTVSITPS